MGETSIASLINYRGIFDYLKRDVEVSESETKLLHTPLTISEHLRMYRMKLSGDRKRNELREKDKKNNPGSNSVIVFFLACIF